MASQTRQLAIITGASSGIGYACAQVFLAAGYQVINVARRSANHADIIDMAIDLADEFALAAGLEQLNNYVSQVDQVALVHNAAYLAGDQADAGDIEILKRSLAVNVLAPTIINRALLPLLPATSSLIYIGSTLSEKAVPGSYSYVSSKHAVAGMMKASCQDLIGKQIHTACICPGFTDTEMLRQHIPDEAVLQSIGANNGFGRLAQPEEIAQLVLWAHQNPVINGSMLHANLGQAES